MAPEDSENPPDRQEIPVERLLLDKLNPRLGSIDIDSGSQEDLVRVLWQEMSVDEVALSIAYNGYYPDEPLLVIPDKHVDGSETGSYIVVEGNRRLAAVMLLRDAGLRNRLKATELPKLSKAALRALETLPAFIHPHRESLWSYLGFRHVNGTRPWDAFSKAKYVAKVHESIGISLDEIANKIGDRHATVRRLYQGFLVLRQAETQANFDVRDRYKNRFSFSHLYTAVDYPEVATFLGITESRWARKNPVPKRNLGDLADLMIWLYGRQSDGTKPVIRTQHPDLGYLRRVLGSSGAVSLLRSGYGLDEAYDESRGDKVKFREALSAAKQELQNAKAAVTTGYKGEDELYDIMEALLATAQSVRDEMSAKRSDRAKRKAS